MLKQMKERLLVLGVAAVPAIVVLVEAAPKIHIS
jgi:hypothetical protein